MTDKKDERPKVKSISLGLAKPDDPIYDSDWRFIMGKQLNSNLKPKKEDE